jgi:hypothetical protein
MKIRAAVFAILVASTVGAAPVGTDFTYQGVLSDGGSSVTGVFDFRFVLYDAEVGGSQVGPIVFAANLTVTDGRVNTRVDFGDVFDGTALWLEISVRDGAATGAYTVLSPRQALTAAPFAHHSKDAETADLADDAILLNGQPAAYYLAWSNLVGVPGEILDGDDDALGELACGPDEIARWDGGAWSCSFDDDSPYTRTYVVGPVGPPLANGVALDQALGSIPAPVNQETAAMLKIEPGVYDLGTSFEALLPWVIIEGAGRDHTRITSAHCGTGVYDGTFVSVSESVTLRGLTVENTCAAPSSYSIALSNQGSDLTVEDARLVADLGAHHNVALRNSGDVVIVRRTILEATDADNTSIGLWNHGVGATLEDVTVIAAGSEIVRGIENDETLFRLKRGVVSLFGGVSECSGFLNNTDADPLYLSDLEIKNFCTSASDNGLVLNGTSGTLRNVIVFAEDTAVSLHNLSNNNHLNLLGVELETSITGYGVWCQDEGTNGMGVRIERSAIRTGGIAVYNHLDECTVRIGASQIEGGVVGAATCAAVYDSGFTFYPDTCPP